MRQPFPDFLFPVSEYCTWQPPGGSLPDTLINTRGIPTVQPYATAGQAPFAPARILTAYLGLDHLTFPKNLS